MTRVGIRVPGPQMSLRTVVVALAGRRDVIPLTTELVVGHDDHRVLGALAALDGLEQVDTRWSLPFGSLA